MGYPECEGRLLTRYSPVRHSTSSPKETFAFDLHVLSTPPAFVLSQDQTLQLYILTNHLKLKLKKSRIGLQQKIAATAHGCFGLLCIGPPYYCSVFKDQLRIAAATANIICFVFKVKLYFLAAIFLFSTIRKRCSLLLLVAVGRYSNMLSVKVSS